MGELKRGRARARMPDDRPIAEDGRDQRDAFQRDRDRILYSSAFRRLAGVTQVVAVAEGHVFHNRLTHSIKVAQVGRRLAEKVSSEKPRDAERLHVIPEVVEAAALAHDLGHPPFGHLGEHALNDCMTKHGLDQHGSNAGYEGNAQSFRIVTRLALRREGQEGLNLTRATLDALLKYPWVRQAEGPHAKKWGAYGSEKEFLDFARAGREDEEQCAGAFLMDWADDITYSIHDIEDFYRAGVVPLDRLVVDSDERSSFLVTSCASIDGAGSVLDKLLAFIPSPLWKRFRGVREQRAALRFFVSTMVGRYVQSVQLTRRGPGLAVSEEVRTEVAVLKNLMKHYVFGDPALAAQQYGQRRVLLELFDTLFSLAQASGGFPRNADVLPVSLREACAGVGAKHEVARLVCDAIASMTEPQVLALHGRLMGHSPGSIVNKIVL